ncbi:MAG: DUF2283 domain-containing protein [Calditrichaeota bacterium]|nr:MAG: DUF2283 domain-containing protein [Calditrichota bacterium]
MAPIDVNAILTWAPQIIKLPFKNLWLTYDEEADVLYINFKKPAQADDSELTDDDIIIRYQKGEIIGITILHVSTRVAAG